MSRSLFAATARRIVRAGAVAVLVLLAWASAAAAAPTWLAAFEPLPASSSYMVPAMNAGGEILFADQTDVGGGKKAFRVASRAPSGSVSAPILLPPAGSTTLPSVPSVALADDGHAVVAWADGGSAFYALRSPAGVWSAPVAVPGAFNVTSAVAAIDANGTTTLGWAENTIPSPSLGDMNSASVKVVRISPAGFVGGSQTLLSPTPSGSTTSVGTLRVAGTGRAVFVYSVNSMLVFVIPTVAFRDSATGAFGSAVDLGLSLFPFLVSIDVSDSGRAALAQPAGANIALRVREAGGALGSATNVGAGGSVSNMRLGLAGDGTITLAWDIQTGGDSRVLACTVSGSDCAGDPQRLSAPITSGSLNLSSLAVNAAGAALVAWNTVQSTPTVVRSAKAALRPTPNAAFGPPQDVAPPPAQSPSVLLDAAGDGVAAFSTGTAFAGPFKAAGFDATGPHIDAFAAPASIAQRARAAFSASAGDLWSPFGLSWSFGDGASASGSPVSHAFAAHGSLRVTVTATDGAGNSSSRSAIVIVRDTIRPSIRRLTIANVRFRVGPRSTATSAAKGHGRRGRIPRGTTIHFTLSEGGTATFRIERPAAGRRVGKVCKKPTRANRRHHACKRYARAGTLTRRHARKGANTLAFSGRIGRKALAPGSYRLTLTVRDAARNASKPKSLGFVIVRG